MKWILSAALLLAPFATAAGQSCAPIMCPEKYMPTPVAPTSQEKQAIKDAVVLAQNAALQEAQKRASLPALRKAALSDPNQSAAYASMAAEVKAHRIEKERNYAKAIQLTIDAYHLTPPQLDLRTAVDSPIDWRVKRREPHYSEEEIKAADGGWRRRTSDELRAEAAGNSFDSATYHIPGTAHAATTDRSGAINLLPNLFSDPRNPDDPNKAGDPDSIAILILHETAHWVDTSATNGRRMSDRPESSYRLEMRAYSYQADFAHTLGHRNMEIGAREESGQFGQQANTAESEHLEWGDIAVRYPKWLKADGSGSRGTILPIDPSSETVPDPARTDGDIAFLQGVANAGKIPQQARDTFASQEAAAQAAWQQDPEYLAYKARIDEIGRSSSGSSSDETRRIQRHFEDMRNRWEYLREMTGLACSKPGALERLAAEGKAPGVSLDDLDLDWEMSRIEVVSMKERPIANSCQKYILTAIQRTNGLTSGAQMIALARGYRDEHPTLIQKFGTSIGDFFKALGSGGGDSDSSGGGIVRERGERNSQDTPGGNDIGDAMRRSFDAQREAQKLDEEKLRAKIHGIYFGDTNGKSFDGNKASKVTP